MVWRRPKKPKRNDPAEQTEDDVLARLKADGGWVIFGEDDNVIALMRLVDKGAAELDPDHTNVFTSMRVSLRARATKLETS